MYAIPSCEKGGRPGNGRPQLKKTERVNTVNKVVATQIRLPAAMHEYIKQEANRMGIAQNAFLVILLEQGKRLWEADVNLRPTTE